MRVLLLCNKPPFPPVEGGALAMEATVRGLTRVGVKVDILAVESEKYSAGKVPEDLRDRVTMTSVGLDLRLRPLPALWTLLTGRSYHLARFRSATLEKALVRLLTAGEYDIVQFETPFLGQYLPLVRRLSRARVVLRAHNAEHRIWERIASQSSPGPRKVYLQTLSRQLRTFEASFAAACDGIASISELDACWFSEVCATPVVVYPYGRDVHKASSRAVESPNARLFHLGSMNWKPNEEGIAWMLSEIWPLVEEKEHTVELHLAGRHMPDWLMQGYWPGVKVHGEIPDSTAFMLQYGIMVVPLLSGSGLRIKIIEGMEAGRAIISTTLGAEGIPLTHGEDILLADSPQAFADGILELVSDSTLREKLGRNARASAAQAFDNARFTRELLDFYASIGAKISLDE
jgi:glycosyltransferase involved in cell wall biosynthesis